MAELDHPLYQQLCALLQPGEELVWHGAPAKGLHLRSPDWFFLPASIVWLVLLIFTMFWLAKTSLLLLLLPLPIFTLGLCSSIAPYVSGASKRKNSYYGVTDQRVILVEPSGVTILPLYQIPVLELERYSSGVGTIYLSEKVQCLWLKTDVLQNNQRQALWFIPHADSVYGIIQQQIARQVDWPLTRKE